MSHDVPVDVSDAFAVQAAMRAENFPVAIRILPRSIRTRLTAAYAFARYVDDIGDAAPGDRTRLLDRVAAEVDALYRGEEPTDPVVARLAPLANETTIPAAAWQRLIQANVLDQKVSRYEDFDELLGYCQLSANPVGEIVLHIFDAATPERIAASDQICTGLQLLEHWQDVGEDHRAGRVYLPQCDLRRFDVDEAALAEPVASARLRDLMAFETDRALRWIDDGARLVPMLHGWAKLAVSGYVAGGRAAARQLQRADHDPMRARKPTARDMAIAWVRGVR